MTSNVYDELITVRDYLRYGMSEFERADLYYGHGTDNALDEVLSLITYELQLPYEELDKCLDARLTTRERQAILGLFKRRIDGRVPAAYITNKAFFNGLEFYVNEHVLVPRSPIAELIDNQFEPFVDSSEVSAILDMCTGSGCIAIALSYAFPEASVDAVDISPEAIKVAKKNVAMHQLDNDVEVIESDLFTQLSNRKYDLIISNPPYVSTSEMETLPEEYHREPRLGLEAKDNGLAIVDVILEKAKTQLNEGGVLVVEVGNSEEALLEKYPEVPFTWLTFGNGGQGVFLLTYDEICEHF